MNIRKIILRTVSVVLSSFGILMVCGSYSEVGTMLISLFSPESAGYFHSRTLTIRDCVTEGLVQTTPRHH